MSNQLPADLYLRPAGSPAADRHPTISLGLAEDIAKFPGVVAVERLRVYRNQLSRNAGHTRFR